MSTQDGESPAIPVLELHHQGQPSHMAFRSMQEIELAKPNGPEIPHRHTYYTVVWLRKGEGVHTLDFKQFSLRPECICIIAPGQVHNFSLINPEGLVWMFTPDFLITHNLHQIMHDGIIAPFACDVQEPQPVPNELQPALYQLFKRVEFEINQAPPLPMQQEALAASLRLFLVYFRRILPEQTAPLNLNTSLSLPSKFKHLVEKHFTTLHTVSDYANHLQVTPAHLNESLKNEIGQTPKQVIAERIILEAKRLAVHSQLSTKEVAYSLGFEDPLHFGKLFKSKVGNSFLAFRQSVLDGTIEMNG